MPKENKIAALADIATEVLVAELQRRSNAKLMSVNQLIEEAGKNWNNAETDSDKLAQLGHETDEKL